MDLLTREQIIELVARLKKADFQSEEETNNAIAKLKNGVIDPKITDYIFFSEMTPEEIADKALSYKPILL